MFTSIPFVRDFLQKIFEKSPKEKNSLLNHTVFTFITGLLSFIIFFIYIFISLSLGRFEFLFIAECAFAFLGVFFLWNPNIESPQYENRVQVFQKIKIISLYRCSAILLIICCISFIITGIFIIFSNIDLYFYVVLCAPSEELFFRGFYLSKLKRIYIYSPFNIKITANRSISLLEFFSVLSSSCLFTALHINYYENFRMLILLFCGGLILGWLYWRTEDLTACIFAHLFINIVTGLKLL